MKNVKAIIFFLVLGIVLTGCFKKESTEKTLLENEYYLVALDGEKQLITLPEKFSTDEKEKEISVLKSYYNSCSTELFTLHYFLESDEYSADDIEKQMKSYVSEYQELTSANDGKILAKTDMKDFSVGEQKGKYVEVRYTIKDSESYCAEFYIKKGNYVLHGTIRLGGEDAKDITITDLAKKLME